MCSIHFLCLFPCWISIVFFSFEYVHPCHCLPFLWCHFISTLAGTFGWLSCRMCGRFPSSVFYNILYFILYCSFLINSSFGMHDLCLSGCMNSARSLGSSFYVMICCIPTFITLLRYRPVVYCYYCCGSLL